MFFDYMQKSRPADMSSMVNDANGVLMIEELAIVIWDEKRKGMRMEFEDFFSLFVGLDGCNFLAMSEDDVFFGVGH